MPTTQIETVTNAHHRLAQALHHQSEALSLIDLLAFEEPVKEFPEIPDPDIKFRVLDWYILNLLSPEQREQLLAQPQDLEKFVLKSLTFISMSDYLHAVPPELLEKLKVTDTEYQQILQRLETASKLYAWLFSLDDSFGTEQHTSMTTEETQALKLALKTIIEALTTNQPVDTTVLDGLNSPRIATLRQALITFPQLLEEIRAQLPDTPAAKDWDQALRADLLKHLTSGNTNFEHQHLTPQEYFEKRTEISGMNVAKLMGEFIYQRFLNRSPEDAARLQLYNQYLAEAGRLYMFFGGLGNDLFSLPKEVLDEGSVTNAVAVMYLSLLDQAGPTDTTELYLDAIWAIIELLDQTHNAFVSIKNKLLVLLEQDLATEKITQEEYDAFLSLIEDWKSGIYATIVWEAGPAYLRYAHRLSVFMETQPDQRKVEAAYELLGFSPKMIERLKNRLTHSPSA